METLTTTEHAASPGVPPQAPGSAETPPWDKISHNSQAAYRELMQMHPVAMSQTDLRRVIIMAVLLGRQIEAELSLPNVEISHDQNGES